MTDTSIALIDWHAKFGNNQADSVGAVPCQTDGKQTQIIDSQIRVTYRQTDNTQTDVQTMPISLYFTPLIKIIIIINRTKTIFADIKFYIFTVINSIKLMLLCSYITRTISPTLCGISSNEQDASFKRG